MIDLSLSFLCSSDTYDQVLKDIDELISYSLEQKFHPFILVVGNIFVEITCARLVCKEVENSKKYKNIEKFDLGNIIEERRLTMYKKCEEQGGKIGFDKTRKLILFYDPDEFYISLQCIDKSRKATQKELMTGDGYPICSLRYKSADTLEELFGRLLM